MINQSIHSFNSEMLNFRLRVPSQGSGRFHVDANLEDGKISQLHVKRIEPSYSFTTRTVMKAVDGFKPPIAQQNVIYNYETNTIEVNSNLYRYNFLKVLIVPCILVSGFQLFSKWSILLCSFFKWDCM
jgi:hypothetical protein